MRLLTLALMLVLSGCGKFSRTSSGETSVSFSVAGNRSLTAVLPGIMIYAIRVGNPQSKGAKFLANESTPSGWVIPNGNYDFLAFGYTGGGITGTMHCGKAQNVALSGGAATVTLVLDDSGICGTPPFSPTGFEATGGHQPLGLKIASCDSSTGSFGTIAPPSFGCDASGGRPGQSNIETVKISLPEFTRWNPGEEAVDKGPGLVSACITGPFNGAGTVTGLAIPAGPFPVLVETFSVSACTGFMGAYTFINGISAAHDNSSVRFMDGSNTRVFPGIQMALGTYAATVSSYLFLRVY